MATTATSDSLGTGRRKSAIARVRIRAGKGNISINRRGLDDYFYRMQDRNTVLAPLIHTGTRDQLDVIIRVGGGGIAGQAHACKLGIARALKSYNGELEETLRDGGLLTRDGRAKERKKPGLRGARRGTQFSKR